MFIFASKNTPFAKLLFNKLVNYYHLDNNNNNDNDNNEAEPRTWTWIQNKKELKDTLTLKNREKIQKVFFFHWSFIVPEIIFSNYECIVIHTANLPNGRGGSPIQNQISDNVVHSHVNALRMTGDLDGGDIYCRKPITLQGTLNDIWHVIAISSFDLIKSIVDLDIKCQPQAKPTSESYKRRKDNKIPFEQDANLRQIYDFIRMLDGNNYPKSYVELGAFRLEFSRASYCLDTSKILCDVKISKKD